MLWEDDVFDGGVYNFVCALLQRTFKLYSISLLCWQSVPTMTDQRNYLCWFCHKLVCQVFVKLDQVLDIDITIILLL
jgi:hypothetical protein